MEGNVHARFFGVTGRATASGLPGAASRVSKVKIEETKPHDRPNELSQPELDTALKRLAAWKLVHRPNHRAKTGHATEFHRQFSFESFEDAMHFMLAASRRIILMDHHPEWHNSYKSISVWSTTWETGFKPSLLDVELAAFSQRVAASRIGTLFMCGG